MPLMIPYGTDYGRPERKWPSLHGQKFNPNPKFLGSIFCLPHLLNFSDIFELCLYWVSVVRALWLCSEKIFLSVCKSYCATYWQNKKTIGSMQNTIRWRSNRLDGAVVGSFFGTPWSNKSDANPPEGDNPRTLLFSSRISWWEWGVFGRPYFDPRGLRY